MLKLKDFVVQLDQSMPVGVIRLNPKTLAQLRAKGELTDAKDK